MSSTALKTLLRQASPDKHHQESGFYAEKACERGYEYKIIRARVLTVRLGVLVIAVDLTTGEILSEKDPPPII